MSETQVPNTEDLTELLDEIFGPKPTPRQTQSSHVLQKITGKKWAQILGVTGIIGIGIAACGPKSTKCTQTQSADCTKQTSDARDHNRKTGLAISQFEENYNLKHFGSHPPKKRPTKEECDKFHDAYTQFYINNNLSTVPVPINTCEVVDKEPGYSCGTVGEGTNKVLDFPIQFPTTCLFPQIPTQEPQSEPIPDGGEPNSNELNTHEIPQDQQEPMVSEPIQDQNRDGGNSDTPSEQIPENTQPEPDAQQPDIPDTNLKPQFIVKCDETAHPTVHTKGHPLEINTASTHFEVDANVQQDHVVAAVVAPNGSEKTATMFQVGSTTAGGLGIPKNVCDPLNTNPGYFAKLRTYIIGKITQPGDATNPREIEVPQVSMRVMEHASDIDHPTICPRDINTAKCKPGQQPQTNVHPGFSGQLPDNQGNPPTKKGKLTTICNQVWTAAAQCATITQCKIVGAWKKLTVNWSSPIGRTYSEVTQARTNLETITDPTNQANAAAIEMRCENQFK